MVEFVLGYQKCIKFKKSKKRFVEYILRKCGMGITFFKKNVLLCIFWKYMDDKLSNQCYEVKISIEIYKIVKISLCKKVSKNVNENMTENI